MLSLGLPYEFRGNPKITKDHGLLKGCYVNQDVEGFAADFISNFMADLETYLDRAPQLKKEMLKQMEPSQNWWKTCCKIWMGCKVDGRNI